MAKFVMRDVVRFDAPVVVREPGSGLPFDFIGIFEVADLDEKGERDILAAFKGWREIADEGADDGVFAVTPENRARLLKKEHVRLAIIRAYVLELQKLPEKNVETPADAGPAPAANGRVN